MIVMDMSIIIPTYNNAKILSRTLKSLRTLPISCGFEWELVVVNNNSTDNTDEVVRSYVECLPIKLIFEGRQGTSVAKNTGINSSTGKLIVFTDDDVRPARDWLNVFWGGYCENPVGCFWGGPVISEFESEKPPWRLLRYAPPSVSGLDFGNQQKVIGRDQYFIGANWSCPRAAIVANGGFDVNMGLAASDKWVRVGEETDLMSRLRESGCQGIYLPQAINHHFVPAVKTTLQHIASREEAHAYYAAMKVFSGMNLRGVPRWLFRVVVEGWFGWQLNRLLNRAAIDEYIKYKRDVGKFRAARDCVND